MKCDSDCWSTSLQINVFPHVRMPRGLKFERREPNGKKKDAQLLLNLFFAHPRCLPFLEMRYRLDIKPLKVLTDTGYYVTPQSHLITVSFVLQIELSNLGFGR
ncbi:hypothetical protein E1B28_009323 [Marasmius oreades]|uniref:Uncharacterized protein n=1 Tax=Marasmius oreades TaxID=181124 RepID=A0A9P7S0D3_9AGAR|nr:uncharacterized protein E1B28_009323 [Marasmius oreades]KAG7093027.1 hypothetical protein E1B28_009323 [Marasmius oreades]